jgi:hypothetical protein
MWRLLPAAVALAAFSAVLPAQEPSAIAPPRAPSARDTDWWPAAAYDPRIPTPRDVLGHEIGDYWTEHVPMLGYMRRLEAVSDRVKVFSVGHTHERREIVLIAVSAPKNMARLEEIRGAMARLRDPRTLSEPQARGIARAEPAIAWLSFANDGNESAAFETAIQLAYHLTAATDPDSRRILDQVVTLIYPAHNPDSHSRHVAWMKASATGNPDPDAQEHRGDWRMDTNNNHYQIDLNRDAAFLSQIESRTIVRELHRWNPVVFIDHHGNPDRFFFPPWALPVNVHLDEASRNWVQTYGRNIAAAFDRRGWTYFTRQVFDLHYPGYFDSYPTLNGATGMTFETDGGGSKGLAYRLPDNRVTTLFDGALHHFTGAMATLATTAEHRESRLFDLYRFRAAAMAEVQSEKVKQFVLLPGKDPARAADLVDLLLQHQIEVYRANAPFTAAQAHALVSDEAGRTTFPAGAFVVPAAQPQKRLLRTLLDRETPFEEEFLRQVRAAKEYNDRVGQAAPREPYGFYDIHAWALPLAYGVEAFWTEDAQPASALTRLTERPRAAWTEPARARFAYLFRWNSRGATRLVAALWKQGHQVAVATRPFTAAGRAFDAGVVVVRRLTNDGALHERLVALARDNEVEVVAVDSALVQSGRDLGDRSVVDLKPARIAVVTEEPTATTAYGAIWYLLEQHYGIPFTALRGEDLGGADLSKYNVLVLPDGGLASYTRVFSTEVTDRLKAWVKEGGTLVAIKGAAAWAAGERIALTTARDRYAEPPQGDKPSERREAPRRIEAIPGVFVQATVDANHFLGLGVEAPVVGLYRSDVVFAPTQRGASAVTLSGAKPVVAGFAFEDGIEALKNAPYVWDEPTGRGRVSLFADDVTFRTFLHGAHRLFLNAILLGPSQ